MSDWTIGAIPLRYNMEKPALQIPGWVNGTFGLDWRPAIGAASENHDGLWVVTHLGTGFSAGAVSGFLDEAQEFVRMIEAACDWSFTDADETASRAQPFTDARTAWLAGDGDRQYFRGSSARQPLMKLPA